MARILTGDRLIEAIRTDSMAPEDVSAFDDDKILEIVDRVMQSKVINKLVALSEEHLTVSVDLPKNSSGIYEIPYRALGNKVRDISLVSGNTLYELSQIDVRELPDYRTSATSNYDDMDLFHLKNNNIHLLNNNRGYEYIRIYYHLRPSYITKLERAGIIDSIAIDEGADTVTFSLSQVGKDFTSSGEYDIVGKRTPNKIKKFDLTPISLTTGTTGIIVFSYSDLKEEIDSIVVGDYVTLAEETPVPNIPTEMHPLLSQATVVNILSSLTDTEALGNAKVLLKEIEESVTMLIDNRVEGAPKKIKPRHGPLRSQIRGNR